MERVMQRLVAVLAVLALMVFAASAQADCKGKVGKFEYDLSPLAAKIGAVDLQATDNTNQVYFYRVCGVVSSSFCQTVTDNTPAVCQKDSRIPAQYHDCGSQKTAKFQRLPSGSESDGFTLAFSGGEEDRAAMVYFKCDRSKEVGTLKFVKEDPIKTYDLEYSTKYACPTNGGGGGGGGSDDDDGGISGGWIFIIILSSLLVLYLIGGVAFNKFYRHHEGKEIIPNVDFWIALPGLVKDGHLFIWRKARSLTGRGSYEEM